MAKRMTTIQAMEIAVSGYYIPGRSTRQRRAMAKIDRVVNSHDLVVKALRQLLAVCPCRNGCECTDMTCAANVARVALAKAAGKRK